MKHLDNNEPKDNDDLDNKLERILSDLVMDIRVAENLGKTVDEMLVPSDKAKAAITKQIIQAEKAKDNAYWERNQLVAYLASEYESHMVRHPDSDKEWEDDWRWIVCIHTPAGQMTWHIHDSECTKPFGFLLVEPDAEHWDGHTTEEKYARLAALQNELKKEENDG